jgi:hypothetical protein
MCYGEAANNVNARHEVQRHMEQPQRKQNEDTGPNSGQQIVPTSVIPGSHEQQETNTPNPQADEPKTITKRPKNTWRRKTKRYLLKLSREGPDRHIELLLALVIASFAGAQYSIMKSSSKTSTEQINKLIGAANQIQQAGWTFSGAAEGINYAGWSAVNKLNEQAKQMGGVATQTGNVAAETKRANENVLNSDRPWFGAILDVQNFDVGKVPVATVVFTNSGKRPARTTLTQSTANFFRDFPKNPPYVADSVPSTAIVVPGGNVVTKYNLLKSELDQPSMDAANSPYETFYIYADIEYIDVILNKPHWAHFCWRYIGNLPELNKGFYGCEEYNNTDN